MKTIFAIAVAASTVAFASAHTVLPNDIALSEECAIAAASYQNILLAPDIFDHAIPDMNRTNLRSSFETAKLVSCTDQEQHSIYRIDDTFTVSAYQLPYDNTSCIVAVASAVLKGLPILQQSPLPAYTMENSRSYSGAAINFFDLFAARKEKPQDRKMACARISCGDTSAIFCETSPPSIVAGKVPLNILQVTMISKATEDLAETALEAGGVADSDTTTEISDFVPPAYPGPDDFGLENKRDAFGEPDNARRGGSEDLNCRNASSSSEEADAKNSSAQSFSVILAGVSVMVALGFTVF